MSSRPGRLRATTVTIDDPGDLIDYLPRTGSAFLRGTEGFVAIGEAARCPVGSADQIDQWWAGMADSIEHDSEVPGWFGTGPLLLASLPFDPRSEREPLAIIPEVVIGRRGGISWLTTISSGRPESVLPERQPRPGRPTDLEFLDLTHTSDEWMALVETVIEAIRAGRFDKMVLARDLQAAASDDIDPRWLLHRLITNSGRAWCYQFDGLVGVSPELVLHRRRGLITSRVVAGTLPRIDGMAETSQVAQLISSPTELADHRVSLTAVRAAVGRFLANVHVPEGPFVLSQTAVFQLTTDLTGIAAGEASTLAMMGALHPGAAVCGAPEDADAFDIVASFEGMDRGRYRGPIGWMDAQGDGDWTAALSCAQLLDDQRTLRLFSGSGIVASSNPHREFVETEAKLSLIRDALVG